MPHCQVSQHYIEYAIPFQRHEHYIDYLPCIARSIRHSFRCQSIDYFSNILRSFSRQPLLYRRQQNGFHLQRPKDVAAHSHVARRQPVTLQWKSAALLMFLALDDYWRTRCKV